MMEVEMVNNIIKANNGATNWTDLYVPAHIKRIAANESLEMGNIDIGIIE